ncbi:8-amino-7-oxononanoate synthase [Aquabacter spiritensis]|uniref:8-amino-7-oxononanoate synthase n=1 Tax=Aquabacter spiritensis TaxID=933073 RepID=A0A4R3M573_9HYPH|nr:8-amino-7-oxononanoate synthase [Aquabacter spiritensis]TCT08172.1 8-amino-7-oxononanoate synthase [Aquabacter spiritensis]
MNAGRLGRYEATLAGLRGRSRGRALEPRAGHDFASNDYLGLAASPRLRDAIGAAAARGVPAGAAGSRLLRGNDPEHEALEEEAARFFGAEGCLFFASGFDANLALFSTLPRRGDLVVHDALIHASVHAGMQAGKAEHIGTPHNDAGAVEDAIVRWRGAGGTGIPFIAVESIYSMDGDAAPLADLVAIAERHAGFLVVDEAHATGVFGRDGRGLAADYEGRDGVIAVHTCGKALGVSGALVTAPRILLDFLVNRARPFIYATAPSPLIAAGVREALRILADEPDRRTRLAALVKGAEGALTQRLGVPPSGSQIIPVLLYANARAAAVAAKVRAAGFDCRAIRPPTVPEGTARLRVSLTLNVDAAAVSGLVDAIATAMDEVPA